METFRLALEFVDDRKSDLPHNPVAHISLKSYRRDVPDGPLLITPDCVTIRELEYQIDELESELEVIRKEAKAKFAADDRRQSRGAEASK